MMNDKRSSRMDIATYGAIMNVKYDLTAKGHSSFQEYYRKNMLYDPVNTVLGYHMNTANCQYTKRLQKKREEPKKNSLEYGPATASKETCEKIGKGKSEIR